MTEIPPTIGRVMWYKNSHRSDQFMACTVAYVHAPDRVNVGGYNRYGEHFCETFVPVFQGPAEDCPEYHVCWMPYQKAQSAKDETTKTKS